MGVYRLVLAVMVVLSHADVRILGYNPGVVATISFFLLSGFVMTALIERHYLGFDRIAPFLLDRLARIGPQFYLYLVVTVALLSVYRPPIVQDTIVDAKGIVLNLLIVPLDFYVHLFPERAYMLQAWSLGLEALFYLAFPFILILRIRLPLMALSVAVFLLAFTGWIDTDEFGYRLLPGTLFMFLLGSYLYDARAGRPPAWLPVAWAAVFAFHALALLRPGLDLPYSKEVLMGLLIGLPAVWLLRRQPAGRWDAIAGNLSYGVFLNHNVVLFAALGLGISARDPLRLAACLGVSMAMAGLSYVAVEAPFLRVRRAMRDRRRQRALA